MKAASQIDKPVLIVGGGPVGMTMALCLAKRGIPSCLVELRSAETLPDVKCNHISSRSMELFRSLGISQDLRAAEEKRFDQCSSCLKIDPSQQDGRG